MSQPAKIVITEPLVFITDEMFVTQINGRTSTFHRAYYRHEKEDGVTFLTPMLRDEMRHRRRRLERKVNIDG